MDNKRTLRLMNKFFKKGTYKGEKGWYGYKLFDSDHWGHARPIPKQWKLEDGSVLTLDGLRELDKNINKACSPGIHFATKEWVRSVSWQDPQPTEHMFEVFVPRSNLDNIVIHDGIDRLSNKFNVKVRTDRLTLVRLIGTST